MQEYLVGIDEVGRGPLAGPVGVGVVLVQRDFDWSLLPGVTDSKKLTEKKREEIFQAARKLKASAQLDYTVAMVSASVIDRIGIVPAINLAMARGLRRLTSPQGNPRDASLGLPWGESVLVKLDGGLRAPKQFMNQETIIKGDASEQVIGLASIVAKVTRDRHMTHLASRFPNYNFQQHKGYGTKAHREAIIKNGLSRFHRVSYCKNLIIS